MKWRRKATLDTCDSCWSPHARGTHKVIVTRYADIGRLRQTKAQLALSPNPILEHFEVAGSLRSTAV